jgi:hypothetical protein
MTRAPCVTALDAAVQRNHDGRSASVAVGQSEEFHSHRRDFLTRCPQSWAGRLTLNGPCLALSRLRVRAVCVRASVCVCVYSLDPPMSKSMLVRRRFLPQPVAAAADAAAAAAGAVRRPRPESTVADAGVLSSLSSGSRLIC